MGLVGSWYQVFIYLFIFLTAELPHNISEFLVSEYWENVCTKCLQYIHCCTIEKLVTEVIEISI